VRRDQIPKCTWIVDTGTEPAGHVKQSKQMLVAEVAEIQPGVAPQARNKY